MFFAFDTSVLPNIRLVGHIVYSEPWMHFPRRINEYIMYIIRKGELYIQEEECKYILKAGDMLVLEPDKLHTGYKSSACDYYFIHFKYPAISLASGRSDSELIQETVSKRRVSLASYGLDEKYATDPICYLPKQCHIENANEYTLVLNEAIGEYNRKFEHYKTQVACRIHDLFIRLCREYVTLSTENTPVHLSKTFSKVQTILNFLNREYYRKISSGEIEQMLESNYDYLNRVFHKVTGLTIFSYLNMVRINKAKEFMETTPLKFSEIGYMIGIDNPYYFSKLFKKYAGITPTQYWDKMNRSDSSV